MDVGRPLLDRLHEDAVDELDHRGVGDIRLGNLARLGLLHHVQLAEVLIQPMHHRRRAAALQQLLEQGGELVRRGDHRLDGKARGETDLIQRLLLGGVRRRHEQLASALMQGQDLVLAQQVLLHCLQRQLRRVESLQLHQR